MPHVTPRRVGYSLAGFVILLVILATARLWYLTRNGEQFLRVRFQDSGEAISTLQNDDPVVIRGVEVGLVDSIEMMPDGARVLVRFYRRQDIRQDARAFNLNVSLMGQRLLLIEPGESLDPMADREEMPGIFIPGIAETMSRIVELQQMTTAFAGQVSTIAHGNAEEEPFSHLVQSQIETVDRLVTSLEGAARTVEKLGPALGRLDGLTREIHASLPGVEHRLAAILDTTTGGVRTAGDLLARLDSTSRELQRTSTMLADARGPAAMVLHDSTLIVRLEQSRQALQTMIDLLRGKLPMKLNIKLLGENPSKKDAREERRRQAR